MSLAWIWNFFKFKFESNLNQIFHQIFQNLIQLFFSFYNFFWFDHKKYFCNTFLCKFLAKSWSSRTCVRDRFFLNFKQFSSFFLQCSTGTHMCGAGTPTFRTSAKMQSVSFFVRHRSFFKGAKNREIQKTEKMDLRHLIFWGCLKSAIFWRKTNADATTVGSGPGRLPLACMRELMFPVRELTFPLGEIVFPLAELTFP